MGMDPETEEEDPEVNHENNMAHVNAMRKFDMPRGNDLKKIQI